ncbi:unnamed protein product [Choristocarpus tenellus]
MPSEDFPHADWISTLDPSALASWSRPRFGVSVITHKRPWSLRRLLLSLQLAHLFGEEVSVDIYAESASDEETLSLIDDLAQKWGCRGKVHGHFRVLRGGLIRAVTESYYPAGRHDHGILLEDDIEVSPSFFAWAKWTTLTYQYGREDNFAADLYGVSLYSPRYTYLHT